MIVLASAVEGIGGVETVNRLVLEIAQQAGIPGSVVALRDRPGSGWTASWPGSECASGSKARFIRGAFRRRSDAAGSVTLVTHIGLAPVGRILKAIVPTELIVMLYGVEAWRTHDRYTTWALRACDRVVAISTYTLERFYQSNPALRAIPGSVCYLPARTLAADRPLEMPSRQGLRVTTVGRLELRGLKKGQRELIALWPRVVEMFPHATLCIVGGGVGQIELERLAVAHGVQQQVVFTGAVSDAQLDQLYRDSDVFAMPSQGEGFGLVFAEAMARGIPCIASRLDAGGEVVVDGETGYVVDPTEPAQILHALQQLLGDAALRKRMGEAGRQRAVTVFSHEQFAVRIRALLNGARASSPTRAHDGRAAVK